jgi:hypothetical protein
MIEKFYNWCRRWPLMKEAREFAKYAEWCGRWAELQDLYGEFLTVTNAEGIAHEGFYEFAKDVNIAWRKIHRLGELTGMGDV